MSRNDGAVFLIAAGALAGLGVAYAVLDHRERQAREHRAKAYADLMLEVGRQVVKMRQHHSAAQQRVEYKRQMDDFHTTDRLCMESRKMLRDAAVPRASQRRAVCAVRDRIAEVLGKLASPELPVAARAALVRKHDELTQRAGALQHELESTDLAVGRFECNVDDLLDAREALRESIRTSGRPGREWFERYAHLRPSEIGPLRAQLLRSGLVGRATLSVSRRLKVIARYGTCRLLALLATLAGRLQRTTNGS